MDDNDSPDQALTDLIVTSTLTIADEDRAYRLIVDRAHGRVTHRRLSAAAVAAVLVATIVIAAVASQRHTPAVRVQGDPTSTTATTPRHLPSIQGMATITDGTRDVGYVPRALIEPHSIAAAKAINARTMFPVTNGQGTLVGYLPLGLPFIPLAEAQQPGFDVEAVRAKYDGGCEPQMGNPTFKQEFPLCPPPPPRGLDTTTADG